MSTFNQQVSEIMRSKNTNTAPIVVGQEVMAVTGKGMMAACFPAKPFVVAKINKKTFKTVCGKTIDLINIR